MHRLLILIAISLTSAHAEVNNIKSMSDEVFRNTTPQAPPAPPQMKGDEGERPRGKAEEPNYNQAQRSMWIEQCGEAQKQSQKAFSECYAAKKKANAEEVSRQQREVENRQASPLRSTTPLLEKPELPREPAFRGVDVERTDE